MKLVVEKYPQSEVSPIAGMIIKGVQEGRPLHGGKFDLGDVWSRRDITLMATADSTRSDTLSAERNTNFLFMLVYQPDSVDERQLLYEMARYNFTNFMVRNFDIQTDGETAIRRMLISGFLSYDEALQYARQLYGDEHMAEWLRPCRSLVISEQNLALIGTRFSYDDYQKFYEATFLPLKISDEQLLTIPNVPILPFDDADLPGEEEEGDDDAPQPDSGDLDFDDDFF